MAAGAVQKARRGLEMIKSGILKCDSFKILRDEFESLNFYVFFLKVKVIR